MTAFITIANNQIDQDSPVTAPLLAGLRDNPRAIAEGDPAAPRVKPVIIHVRYKLASSTVPPNLAAATWVGRPYNEQLNNEITGASLNTSTGEVTLPAGTYDVFADCTLFPSSGAALHRARLFNVTAGAILVKGENATADTASALQTTNKSLVMGRFTIAATTVVAIQHRTSTGGRFGHPMGFGDDENYGEARFVKVA